MLLDQPDEFLAIPYHVYNLHTFFKAVKLSGFSQARRFQFFPNNFAKPELLLDNKYQQVADFLIFICHKIRRINRCLLK